MAGFTRRQLATRCLTTASFLMLCGHCSAASRCLPDMEYAPTLAIKTSNAVTFHCAKASPLDLIRAIGYQTRVPIGIVLGSDLSELSRPKLPYHLDNADVDEALRTALLGTGYSIDKVNGVFVLVAGDLSPRQHMLLDYRFTDFKPGAKETMVMLGSVLDMWLKAATATDSTRGYGASILGSLNDETFNLVMPLASTKEIANAIVTLGSKGMWILKVDPSSLDSDGTSISIEPYQHFTNVPAP